MGEPEVRLEIEYLNGNHNLKKHYGTGEAIFTKANLNNPSIKEYLYPK